jgi:hypothetical protein
MAGHELVQVQTAKSYRSDDRLVLEDGVICIVLRCEKAKQGWSVTAIKCPSGCRTHRRRHGGSSDRPPAIWGGTIAFRRSKDDLSAVLDRFNRWWDALCRQHGLDPRSEFSGAVGNHAVEMVKNALRFADHAEVRALVRSDFVEVVVIDDGEGIADPREDISLGEGHGLRNAIAFSDWFSLESRGRRWEKVSRRGPLRSKGASEITTGTRIDLVKMRPRRSSSQTNAGLESPKT